MYGIIVCIIIKAHLLVKCVNATDNARTAVKVQNYIIATLTNFVLSFRLYLRLTTLHIITSSNNYVLQYKTHILKIYL